MQLGYILNVVTIGLVGVVGFQTLGDTLRETLLDRTEASPARSVAPHMGGTSQAAGLGWARHFGKLPQVVQEAARLEMDVLNGVVDLERAQSLAANTVEQTQAMQRAQGDLRDFENLVEAAGASYLTRDPSPLKKLEERLAGWLARDVEASFQNLLAQNTVLNGELPIVRTEFGAPRVTIDPAQGGVVHVTGILGELDAEMLSRVRTFYDAFRAEIDDFGVQLEIALPGDFLNINGYNYGAPDRVKHIFPTPSELTDEPMRVWIGPEVDLGEAEGYARTIRDAIMENLVDPAQQNSFVSHAMTDFDAEARALLSNNGNVREARLDVIRRMALQPDSRATSGHPNLRLFEHVFPDHEVQFLGEAAQGKAGPLYARFTRERHRGKTRDVLELRGDITSPGSVSPEHLVAAADLYQGYGAALLDQGVELHVTMAKGADEAFEGDYRGARFVDIGVDHEAPDAVLNAVVDRAKGTE